MLRKDYADLNSKIIEQRKEIDRIYDLYKWIIGLLFTMSIGVLGIISKPYLDKWANQSGKNKTKNET